jgi:hypothetical protein
MDRLGSAELETTNGGVEMVDVSLRIDGTSVLLDCGPVALSQDDLELRMQQILPLLKLLLEADLIYGSLEEPEFWQQFSRVTAQYLMVEGAIRSATLEAELLVHIITGQDEGATT